MRILTMKTKRVCALGLSAGACFMVLMQLSYPYSTIRDQYKNLNAYINNASLLQRMETAHYVAHLSRFSPMEPSNALSPESSGKANAEGKMLKLAVNSSDEDVRVILKQLSFQALVIEAFFELRFSVTLLNEEISQRYRSFIRETNTFAFLKTQRRTMASFGLVEAASQCSDYTSLVIMVSSGVANTQRRNTIRATWATQAPRWKTIFVLGKSEDAAIMDSVATEMRKHNDILLADFTDSFLMLSYKIEVGFTWIYNNCNFDYILKTDDDVFVNAHAVLWWANQNRFPHLYGGFCLGIRVVFRSKASKYYVAMEDYPYDFFPPYCAGGGILLSRLSLAKMIPYIAKTNPVSMEDAYVGLLAFRAGITPNYIPDFLQFKSETLCNISCYAEEKCFSSYHHAKSAYPYISIAIRHFVPNEKCMLYFHNLQRYLGIPMHSRRA